MRIALTALIFLCGIVAHAAHIAPWNPGGDGVRVGMSANGGDVVVRRTTADGTDSFSYDMVGNLLSATNPNFRDAGVQNAVYQSVVDEWGSPLKRLGAYGDEPVVADPQIVDALWDIGAAATAYRNLGANEPVIKTTTGRVTTDFIGNAEVTSFGKVVSRGTVDVRSTVNGIKNGTIKERTFYKNRDGQLPIRGNVRYYKEYELPTPFVPAPGPQRIIKGLNGELYYTPNHYESFVPLN